MSTVWAYLVLTVVGLCGMVPATREWMVEFLSLEKTHTDEAFPPGWRRRLLPWVLLVVLFGVAAITGLIGIIVWSVRHL